MNPTPPDNHLHLFQSLFRGREDVFAIRWEKGKRNGYMPAYSYDPYLYRIHKMKGGTFKNYKDKTYSRLTDQEIRKHLQGEQFIGIYPLLKDNSSWFIAADFDKERWAEESRKLIAACSKAGLPAYLERSRSGQGGHVWIFFEQPYLAVRSRKIMASLLEKTGGFSIFDKGSSFDRLFPNQDFLSGKGLGNLIALPLHSTALMPKHGPLVNEGKNCFIDPDTLEPYSDQWNFLAGIQRVPAAHLDRIYESLGHSTQAATDRSQTQQTGALHITLSNAIRLNRPGLNAALINFLKEELNFANTEFFIKKKSGRNTWGTKRYFNLVEETEDEIILPRGFIGRLLRFCQKQNIGFKFQDHRKKRAVAPFTCNLTLRKHQEPVIQVARKKEFGVIVAPPGSGKTVMAIKIIAEKEQSALIIVHRKQLLEQWVDRIEAFLGISRKDIGKIGQGRGKVGKQVTVAMIQSLSKKMATNEAADLSNHFGILIVDECHHIPAKTFHETISKFITYYQYGLTATPFRKYSDGKLIFTQLGEIIVEVKPQQIDPLKRARVIIRETSLEVPFNAKVDPFETLSKILVHDTARNKLILKDVTKELQKGNRAVIITERREHIQSLEQFLKQSYETVTLSGEDTEKSRKEKWKLLEAGNFQVVITTGQFFGEGTDLHNVSRLFLVYPFSFKGKLIQYIGRVQRSEVTPIIYDYRDSRIDYLNKLFLKRNKYYRHLERQATLFDDPENEPPPKDSIQVNRRIKVPMEELGFQYGAIAFSYTDPQINRQLEFEIENDYIRPEFEVLKPYFSKVIGSDKVEVEIHIEIENGELVAQMASCPELERINREIIESVKFRFFDEALVGGKWPYSERPGFPGPEQQQNDGNIEKLYGSEEELLEYALKHKNARHYKQLRFLAGRHQGSILKLRFILNPFAFVFLLEGKEQFHIVLETLDTEEATYVWHLEKSRERLPENLNAIDEGLAMIRNKGRQAFLANQPKNFSRIIHNYSDERKGFVLWRDMLEEKLF
ncbi:MAG: DEAD/DEAH box helicase [Phaeodactylibacter sp.]|nr:DEAD/DEAH box helicase [Phaeodactylibacter sp.]